jgi:hypothetical protein
MPANLFAGAATVEMDQDLIPSASAFTALSGSIRQAWLFGAYSILVAGSAKKTGSSAEHAFLDKQ